MEVFLHYSTSFSLQFPNLSPSCLSPIHLIHGESPDLRVGS